MFEVITTSRPDFVETLVEQCATQQEAQAVSDRLWKELSGQFIRIRIRQVCKTPPQELKGRCGEGS